MTLASDIKDVSIALTQGTVVMALTFGVSYVIDPIFTGFMAKFMWAVTKKLLSLEV